MALEGQIKFFIEETKQKKQTTIKNMLTFSIANVVFRTNMN